MELKYVEKELYEKNPPAGLQHIRNGMIYYETQTDNIMVYFKIPLNEMGDFVFLPWMDSRFLIRWIDTFNKI